MHAKVNECVNAPGWRMPCTTMVPLALASASASASASALPRDGDDVEVLWSAVCTTLGSDNKKPARGGFQSGYCRISAHKLCSGSGRQVPARHLLTDVQVRACDHVRRQARQTEWRGFAYEFTPCAALTSVMQAGLTHCAQKSVENDRGKVSRSGFQGRHRPHLALAPVDGVVCCTSSAHWQAP